MKALNLDPEVLLQIIGGLGGRPNPEDPEGGSRRPLGWHGPWPPWGPWIAASTQDPEPARAFADLLSSAVVLQAMTAFISDGALKEKMSTAATGFIGSLTDDYCGTPPGKFPRGHLILIEKAAEIYALASIMLDGELKDRMIASAMHFAETGVSAFSKMNMKGKGTKAG